jgi:hypothetical protein
MSTRPERTLSYEGTLEVLHEIEHGSPDSPERRATFERARAWRATVERLFERNRSKTPADKR